MSAHPNGDTEVLVGHSHFSSSKHPLPFADNQSGAKRFRVATPSPSCDTDAHSSAIAVNLDDDDEDTQSSMWVQQDGLTPPPPPSQLPSDFLEPLSPDVDSAASPPAIETGTLSQNTVRESRQFWKSGGDFSVSYEGSTAATQGIDHARVHPKFLHSNATSHKWVLGAVAELLDNAVDEVRNGATFVKVDVLPNPRNGEPMLLIEDDGGGMDPDCIRHCMSLGYSSKSKLSNTIGQYGNGFKTSTMRLGADVLVFSRSGGNKPSESIGMLSYTFLATTGQNDIVVPIVDFQLEAFGIRKLIRTTVDDWVKSMQTIEAWSPYSSQTELVSQFKSMPRSQGTRIVIYNLWEDEEGLLELDFTTDVHDIQLRTTSRNEKNLKMATTYPSCHHYLTYHHSLRTYASILYLRLPPEFRVILRGKQVRQHNLRDDMMVVEEVTYRPKDLGQAKAVVTLGFIKDAKEHIDVSGFCVYHKNRLIKPFWRLWNPSDTRGRGIIAILEANFVEPAHDKQGFERTIVLSRLETRLMEMQRTYFAKNCPLIGYRNPTMRRNGRLASVDVSSKTNGGNTVTERGDVVTGTSVARSYAVENTVSEVLHPQSKNRELERQGVSSTAPLMHGMYVDHATICQSSTLVDLAAIHRALTDIMGSRGLGQSNMQRQDPAPLSDSGPHHMQRVPRNPAKCNVEVPRAPVCSVGTSAGSGIQACGASSSLMPNFIDLESPESSPRSGIPQNQTIQAVAETSSSTTANLSAVVVVKEEDVKAERRDMDNYGGPLPAFISAGDEVALAVKLPVPDLPELQEDGHAAENASLQNKSTTVPGNGTCIDDNVVDITLGSSLELTERQGSASFDHLDKLTSENGLPQGSATSVKAAYLVAPSPAIMDMPDVILEEQPSPFILTEGSQEVETLSGDELQQADVALHQKVVREIGDREVDCMQGSQEDVKQLTMETEEDMKELAILPDDDDVKKVAILTQESTNLDNHNGKLVLATVDHTQGSTDAIQEGFITSPIMTSAITIAASCNSSDDIVSVDLTSRFWNAKQTIESLQVSIDGMVAETDDIREQLQEQQSLQDLEMKNLHAELQRALLRLEQLKA